MNRECVWDRGNFFSCHVSSFLSCNGGWVSCLRFGLGIGGVGHETGRGSSGALSEMASTANHGRMGGLWDILANGFGVQVRF